MSFVAQVKPARLPRILAGHPWIYESDLIPLKKKPEDGDSITVRTYDGHFIGKGFYNSKSAIRIRLYTRDKTEELNDNWLRRRLAAAIEFRKKFCKPRPSRRLVWS